MGDIFETEAWFWTKNVLNLAVETFVMIIFLVELYFATKTFKKMKSDGIDTKNAILLLVIPLIIYISNAITIFCALVDDFELTNIPCLVWTNIGVVFWLWNKCFLYSLLILRLYIVYQGSAFEYNHKWLLFISIAIIIETLVMSVMVPLNTTVKILYHNNVRICEGIIDFLYIGILVFVDMVVSFLTLYLFLRPLNILLQTHVEEIEVGSGSSSPTTPSVASTINDKANNRHNRRFYGLMIKFATLTAVMVLSTLISLVIIGLFDVVSTSTVDVFINCICIALFNQIYAKYFKSLCCGAVVFVKVFAHYCCCCGYGHIEKENEDVANLSMDVIESQKQTSTI